jgi:ketosteroid isomerase-like protein
MKFLVLGAAGLAAASISSAAMAADAQVEAPIHQFIDAFNKGDIKGAAATHLASVSIVDEFAPHIWQGPNGFMAWAGDLMADAKAHGQTGNTVKLGALKREVVSGDAAYVIVAATYSYKQMGAAMREPGQMTYALKKTAEGWKIAGWSWTGPNPTPAK